MSTLLERLRAQQAPKAPREKKPAPESCYLRETAFAVAPAPLSCEVLRAMQGDALADIGDIAPEDVLFLDTETTGLSGGAGTLAFLTGLGAFEGGRLVVRQYLMRDYDEEALMLSRVCEAVNRCRLLVTFNGASFDMPLLQSRLLMNGMRNALQAPPHADLLHTARRVWKLRLRGCSLSRLEEEIFHEPRVDDIPGAQVPEKFFEYLKCKDMAVLEGVLSHNALDIASLARLLYVLHGLHDVPLTAAHLEDVYSLGRVFEKRGQQENARACYRAANAGKMAALAAPALADSLRKSRDYRQSAQVYERIIATGLQGEGAYIALCKLYEHKLGDPERALAVCRRGLLACAGDETLADLRYRHARLLKKTRRS